MKTPEIIALSINSLWCIILITFTFKHNVLAKIFMNTEDNTLSSHKVLGGFCILLGSNLLSVGMLTGGSTLVGAGLGMFGVKKFEKNSVIGGVKVDKPLTKDKKTGSDKKVKPEVKEPPVR